MSISIVSDMIAQPNEKLLGRWTHQTRLLDG